MDAKHVFVIDLTKASEHCNHLEGQDSFVVCSMNNYVSKAIEDFVEDGVCSVKNIQTLLNYYVKNELFHDSKLSVPPMSNRAYFPSKKSIYSKMFHLYIKYRFSKIDQEELELYIKEWKSKNPKDNFFFRMHSAVRYQSENEEDEKFTEETFLFAHQSEFQKHLFQKYASHGCRLDAAYKTTKYSLPIFFL